MLDNGGILVSQTKTRTGSETLKEREHYTNLSHEEREREFERDEITDAAERLSLPMQHSFDYVLKNGRLYSEFGLSMDEVVQGGLDDSRLKAMFDTDWKEETLRREFQVAELKEAKTLRIGEKLIVFSPIPDDVASGESSIKGYNRPRMRMLVRISERKSETDFSITTFSLDKSNRHAMRSAARAVGHTITDEQSSNEIVSQPAVINGSYASEELVSIIRNAYDSQLKEDLGGEWHAGMPPITPDNAYQHILHSIEVYPDIFEEHKKTIRYIQTEFFDPEKADALENARQNFAARLDALRDNKHFVSAEAAGNAARAEGKTYEGDCPPGMSIAVQAEKLGLAHNDTWRVGETRECVNCPLCGKVVSATRLKTGILCHTCRKELLRSGEIKDHAKNQKDMASTAINETGKRRDVSKKSPSLIFKTELTIGGAITRAFDRRGNVVAEGRAAEKLKRTMPRR